MSEFAAQTVQVKPDTKRPFKAIYAAIVAGVSTSIPLVSDGNLSLVEALGILLAVVVAFGGTYGITNPLRVDTQPVPEADRNARGE